MAMLAPFPSHRNLTLPEAALPGRHVDFDASCSSRPASCPALQSGFIAKIKDAVHNVDKNIAKFVSKRKDKKYCKLQRSRELASRKSRNKLLDSNNRRAINSHRQRNANMKSAIKAQKVELERCKKADKIAKCKGEKAQKAQEKREKKERKRNSALGKEVDRMFGWKLRVDALVKWPVRKLGGMRVIDGIVPRLMPRHGRWYRCTVTGGVP
jgi:hypothetical protein